MISYTQAIAQPIYPAQFDPKDHWYEKALNAQIHPLIAYFFRLTPQQIVNRYCHLNPQVQKAFLEEILSYKPKYFLHAGADLFHVTDSRGERKMVVIETNSCPSGQKSMPLTDENQPQGGYFQYIYQTFLPYVKSRRNKVKGGLAVIYDKNPMEASGYASTMADAFNEPVYYAPFYHNDPDPPVRFREHIMEIRDEEGSWVPIRAAFRYVTQKPWNRIPIYSKTIILNPIISCLAGGRNKMMAAKAYEFFNAEISQSGLKLRTPETIWDVQKNEVPIWIKKLGGHGVIKVPYANAGQGVFTITSEQELTQFMEQEFPYDKFIVQSLIGNFNWSSTSSEGRLYHVGTMPNRKNKSFVADIRMMIRSGSESLVPVAIYARRARIALADSLDEGQASWDMLGTNLSIKLEDGTFTSDSSRLIMMDRKDFNELGISLDDLIEGYIQTVLAMVAIDKMAHILINQKGKLKSRLFRSLNEDSALIKEITLE